MLKVSEITIEYLKNPVGLDGRPWFGWILCSDKKNVCQEAYRLEIAEDENFKTMVYESGWVKGRESIHVEAAGFCPASCKKYFVRVQVQDGEEESSFSEPAFFVTAVLKQDQWKAQFITAEGPEDKDSSGSTYLRKGWKLMHAPQHLGCIISI